MACKFVSIVNIAGIIFTSKNKVRQFLNKIRKNIIIKNTVFAEEILLLNGTARGIILSAFRYIRRLNPGCTCPEQNIRQNVARLFHCFRPPQQTGNKWRRQNFVITLTGLFNASVRVTAMRC